LLSKKLVAIHRTFIALESTGMHKENTTLQCDQVVLSLGVKSENVLYNELKTIIENVFIIGDASESGRIAQATESAYKVAVAIE
jgi:thioredoxin reductase